MVTRAFDRFTLTTTLDETGIDMRHLSSTDIQIIDGDSMHISGQELYAWHAEAFLNGDREQVLEAISALYENRRSQAERMYNLYWALK